MFQAVRRSSSGALTVFAASGLHAHVVTGRSQVCVGNGQFPLRLDYGRSPNAYVNQRLQIQLELLMMNGMPLETCWALNKFWNNKFYYKVASCLLFLLSHTAMHGSTNIKFKCVLSLVQFVLDCVCIFVATLTHIALLLSPYLQLLVDFFFTTSCFFCKFTHSKSLLHLICAASLIFPSFPYSPSRIFEL